MVLQTWDPVQTYVPRFGSGIMHKKSIMVDKWGR